MLFIADFTLLEIRGPIAFHYEGLPLFYLLSKFSLLIYDSLLFLIYVYLFAAMPINLLKINSMIVFLFLNIDYYEDPILNLIHHQVVGFS